MRLGLAGVCQVGSEWWSWELIGCTQYLSPAYGSPCSSSLVAASLLGPVVLASQSVLLVSASTTFQAPYALSIAAAVRVGNLLGEAKGKRAAVATHASFFIAFFIAMGWRYIFCPYGG